MHVPEEVLLPLRHEEPVFQGESLSFSASLTNAFLFLRSYTALNIAQNTILDTVTPIPIVNGKISIDLGALIRSLTVDVPKPDYLNEFQSRMFDYAMENPVIHLVGDLTGEGFGLIGMPGVLPPPAWF